MALHDSSPRKWIHLPRLSSSQGSSWRDSTAGWKVLHVAANPANFWHTKATPSLSCRTDRYCKLEIILCFWPCHLPSDLDFSSLARTFSLAAPGLAMLPPLKMWSQKINESILDWVIPGYPCPVALPRLQLWTWIQESTLISVKHVRFSLSMGLGPCFFQAALTHVWWGRKVDARAMAFPISPVSGSTPL